MHAIRSIRVEADALVHIASDYNLLGPKQLSHSVIWKENGNA